MAHAAEGAKFAHVEAWMSIQLEAGLTFSFIDILTEFEMSFEDALEVMDHFESRINGKSLQQEEDCKKEYLDEEIWDEHEADVWSPRIAAHKHRIACKPRSLPTTVESLLSEAPELSTRFYWKRKISDSVRKRKKRKKIAVSRKASSDELPSGAPERHRGLSTDSDRGFHLKYKTRDRRKRRRREGSGSSYGRERANSRESSESLDGFVHAFSPKRISERGFERRDSIQELAERRKHDHSSASPRLAKTAESPLIDASIVDHDGLPVDASCSIDVELGDVSVPGLLTPTAGISKSPLLPGPGTTSMELPPVSDGAEDSISVKKQDRERRASYFGDALPTFSSKTSGMTGPETDSETPSLIDSDASTPSLAAEATSKSKDTETCDSDSGAESPKSPKEKSWGDLKFTSWFQREKYAYELALINAASKLLGWEDTTFPRSLCEMIILGGVILVPGCYTFTGLLYPSESLVRTAEDLFVEYAHEDRAYLDVRHKVRNGIPFDRKKPKIRFPIPAPPPPREDGSPGELTIADRLRLIDPENNTASLWLDEDGSICGFRCVWVQNMRGRLLLDQKYTVMSGSWSLLGEVEVLFERNIVNAGAVSGANGMRKIALAGLSMRRSTAASAILGDHCLPSSSSEPSGDKLVGYIDSCSQQLVGKWSMVVKNERPKSKQNDLWMASTKIRRGSMSGMIDYGSKLAMAKLVQCTGSADEYFYSGHVMSSRDPLSDVTWYRQCVGDFHFYIIDCESFYLSHNIPAGARQVVDPMSCALPMSPEPVSPHSSSLSLLDPEKHEEVCVVHTLVGRFSELEVNEGLALVIRFQQAGRVSIAVKDMNQYFGYITLEELIEVGYGEWTVDGLVSFDQVWLIDYKTKANFHGCTDGKKLVGRLTLDYDPSFSLASLLRQPSHTTLSEKHSSLLEHLETEMIESDPISLDSAETFVSAEKAAPDPVPDSTVEPEKLKGHESSACLVLDHASVGHPRVNSSDFDFDLLSETEHFDLEQLSDSDDDEKAEPLLMAATLDGEQSQDILSVFAHDTGDETSDEDHESSTDSEASLSSSMGEEDVDDPDDFFAVEETGIYLQQLVISSLMEE